MGQWTATLEVAHGPLPMTAREYDVAIFELVDALEPYGGVVAYAPARDRYAVTVTVDIDDDYDIVGRVPHALEESLDALRAGSMKASLPYAPVVNAHVRTVEEHDRELAEPAFPELVGVAELAELLGLSSQRASALQTRAGFPEPVAVLRSGPVWVKSAVKDFDAGWDRKPGRPRKVTTTETSG